MRILLDECLPKDLARARSKDKPRSGGFRLSVAPRAPAGDAVAEGRVAGPHFLRQFIGVFRAALAQADVEPVAHQGIAVLAAMRAVEPRTDFPFDPVKPFHPAAEPVGPAATGKPREPERQLHLADDAFGHDPVGDGMVGMKRRAGAAEIVARRPAERPARLVPRARVGGDAGDGRVSPLRARERKFPRLRRGRFLRR